MFKVGDEVIAPGSDIIGVIKVIRSGVFATKYGVERSGEWVGYFAEDKIRGVIRPLESPQPPSEGKDTQDTPKVAGGAAHGPECNKLICLYCGETDGCKCRKLTTNVEMDYDSLHSALMGAFKAASEGKGKVRHATPVPFEEQSSVLINNMCPGFAIGQANKKGVESLRLDDAAAIHELEGGIVYYAMEIIRRKRNG